MLLDADECQLLLVDYQARVMPAMHEHGAVLQNAVRLGKLAHLFGVPVIGTEENPQSLGPNIADVSALCGRTLAKMHFSACADGLVGWLRPPPARQQGGNARSLPRNLQKKEEPEQARNTIVMAGCETHVCLVQTALDLIDEEFDVWVVTDACASRRERDRDAAFDRLAAAGCELVTTEMVAFEWLRTAEHAAFDDVLRLIK